DPTEHVRIPVGQGICRGAADALADRDPDMLGRIGALPGAEHELVAVDEVDPDPRVVLEAAVQGLDDLAEHVVRLAAAPDDLLDRLAHCSRSAPSKAPTFSRYQSGIRQALRSARSTSTSVCWAVTISTSSSARYAAHS